MATPNGIITRKDIITDDALQFGSDYAAELEKAIAANKQLLASSLELSKVMSSYRKIDNNQQFLEAKQSEILISQKIVLALKEREAAEISLEKIRQESIKTEKLRQQSENQSQKVKQATVKLTIEERVQNELNNKALKQGALEKLGLIGAYQKLNKERTDAKRKLLDLISTENTSTDAIKKAQKEFDVLAARVKKADDAVNDFTKNVGNYPTIGKLTGSLKNLVGAFGLTAGIAGIASVIKGAFETIKQFNQSIADLSAITGASGKDLDYLKNQAILLGRETKGGAVAVVEAYKLIASAKPELLENVNSLNQVTEATLTLSKAAGIDLPSAATALTDALNQFNAPASEA
ncbi:MAG: hypothetical protein ABI549_11740, partial [Flavobacterium sp.]|uniref:hypothetical protein n=1 Tax=Flavobacterium sp. TaxID=239 RepID=UPI00326667A0